MDVRSNYDGLAKLDSQLRHSLERLETAADATPQTYRPALRRVLANAWRAVASGDSRRLWEIIEVVLEARPLVDDVLPRLTPRETAAIELQQSLGLLYLGESELREIEIEARLSDHGRNPLERAVLEVLAKSGEALRQGEVHERVPEEVRKSLARSGQILRELHKHRYVRKSLRRAPGRRQVSHYLLAPRGWALCRELGLARRIVDRELDPPVAPDRQSTAQEIHKNYEHAVTALALELTATAVESGDLRKAQIATNMWKNQFFRHPALTDAVPQSAGS